MNLIQWIRLKFSSDTKNVDGSRTTSNCQIDIRIYGIRNINYTIDSTPISKPKQITKDKRKTTWEGEFPKDGVWINE